jgi:hypothetical protein
MDKNFLRQSRSDGQRGRELIERIGGRIVSEYEFMESNGRSKAVVDPVLVKRRRFRGPEIKVLGNAEYVELQGDSVDIKFRSTLWLQQLDPSRNWRRQRVVRLVSELFDTMDEAWAWIAEHAQRLKQVHAVVGTGENEIQTGENPPSQE